MNIKELISKELNISIDMINNALAVARTSVKKSYIKKRNGQDRLILQPSKKLKTIQYWLILNVLKKIEVHDAAVAYRDGKSIFHNANLHKDNKYFLKLDLQDFFQSIKFSDLLPKITNWHNSVNPDWQLDISAKELIRLSCFFYKDSLAVGYPSSPIISNIVMQDFDTAVTKLISNKKKFGDVIYTRYADDLVFSTNMKNVSNTLLAAVSKLVASSTSPVISLNASKTKIGSRASGTASVTGLKICDEGRITVHRGQKDHIRLLLNLYKKNELDASDYKHLLGHLAYIHYVDTAFYTKLQSKYFEEINNLRKQENNL